MTLRLDPYLVMEGNAKEAIQFYEKALGAQLVFTQTFGEMPANPDFPLPVESKELIGHAMLMVGETRLMLSDAFPGQPVQKGANVTICISIKDVEKSKQIYHALEDGGRVIMPLTETHFSPAYGQVVDKFGVTFHIFTDQPTNN
ncbi:VOC family protein [Paenibacillus aceris]|uniref:PhnB protein n=1 Tax=Paenibacillus aceris TaxID=869555 RepID=A0ABS4HYY7_9BACL|nr:VOC family protein [Paenibacillus aceris]MBP1963872.1 PhnB protein [Paenibacillus aceris]NHW34708.1 VOC family protein [Paenibacillus aceris]